MGVATLRLRLAAEEDAAEAMRIVQEVLEVKALVFEPALVTAPMADPERITDLLLALREGGIHLAAVSVQEPTPDEVFLTLTGNPPQTEKGATE